MHVIVLVLLIFFGMVSPAAPPQEQEQVIYETKIEEETKQADLTNEDIGLDPEVPLNYNVTRIEEVSVPGPVNPTEAVGIKDAAEGPVSNIPPPPGFGGGSGGGVDADTFGKGNLAGFAGGLGGPAMIAGGFGGRSGSTREQMLREGGGNAISEAAVARGLKWLSLHQSPGGMWSLGGFAKASKCNCHGESSNPYEVGGTAFGLLPFLASGETHKRGIYSKNVDRGIAFLISKMDAEGHFAGDMYEQGLASIALCEAYALTSDPKLKMPAQKVINFIHKSQNQIGGWDYSPSGPVPDTSISGWNMMAVKSAQMGGLNIPKELLNKSRSWLDWAQDSSGAIYGYRQANAMNPSEGGASPQTMVAIGLLLRLYQGWGPRHPAMVKGAHWMMLPENLAPGTRSHMYFNYYATQVMHHLGGKNWDKWNTRMRDWLIAQQDKGIDPKTAHQKGSWDNSADWWCNYGGRIMMTSVCLLTLEVYYRHLPLYRRDTGGKN
jgi:hypothetical protein